MDFTRLTNALLLSTIAKRAITQRIRPISSTKSVVELRLEGYITEEELRAPVQILLGVMRRPAVMARLPVHREGEYASGFLHLLLGNDQHAYFAVELEGHGVGFMAHVLFLDEISFHEEVATTRKRTRE